MGEPQVSQLMRLQRELGRVSLLKNRTYECRIGEMYCSVFANTQLVKDFDSIAAVILWLQDQAADTTRKGDTHE